jgi:hypothetical protein
MEKIESNQKTATKLNDAGKLEAFGCKVLPLFVRNERDDLIFIHCGSGDGVWLRIARRTDDNQKEKGCK